MACTVRVSRPTEQEALHLGETIEIEWTAEGATSQQLEVSVDGGASYAPIAKDLGADVQRYAWTIPHELLGDDPTPRDARFRVVARDAEDETAIGLGARVTILPKRVVLEPLPVVPPRDPLVVEEAKAKEPEPPPIVESKAEAKKDDETPKKEGPAPIVSSLDPSRGSVLGGVRVIVRGEHFSADARVDFGGAIVPATLEDGALVAVTPPRIAEGRVDVRVLTDAGVAVSEGAFEYVAQPAPKIASVSPGAGPVAGGTTLCISGESFVHGATVEIDGVDAPVENVESTAIVATTPPHLAAGIVDVRVKNPDGQSAIAIGAFRYDRAASGPKILRVTPARGPARGGTRLAIAGDAFGEGARVDLGGVDVTATMENGELVVTTPRRAEGGAVWVRVTRADGSFDVAPDAFVYDAPLPPPKIRAISPEKYVIGSESKIVVEGEGFQDGCIVGFDGRDVAATCESATRIVVLPPPHSAAIVDVRVINPDGGVDVRAQCFEYVLPPAGPAIVGIRPNQGSVLGGTVVTLRGTNFGTGTRVELSGLEVRATLHDANTIEITTTPKNAPCFVDVKVINPDGASFVVPSGFMYEKLPAPVLEGIEPQKGPAVGGTEVTLHGQNFVAHAHTSVRFGDRLAPIVRTTPTAIVVKSPPGDAGLVEIAVQLPDGQRASRKNAFQYEAVPRPELTTVSPKYGSASGGEVVTLLGKNFFEGMTVLFGSVACKKVKLVDGKTLEVVAPPQTSQGMVDVTVKNGAGGSATMKLAFQYTR